MEVHDDGAALARQLVIEARALLKQFISDGRLQTFADRERFRLYARAWLAKLDEPSDFAHQNEDEIEWHRTSHEEADVCPPNCPWCLK